jgi:hypothetical protein
MIEFNLVSVVDPAPDTPFISLRNASVMVVSISGHFFIAIYYRVSPRTEDILSKGLHRLHPLELRSSRWPLSATILWE